MKFFCTCVCLVCLLAAGPAAAQDAKPATATAAATAEWTGISRAAFDPAKSAPVENVTLARDRIRMTLISGTIRFTRPVAGKVFGAAFEGEGRIKVTPPSALEEQQLELFTGQKELDMGFTQATFCFNDGTYKEIARQVKWVPGTGSRLERLYGERQREREDDGEEILPRLFQAVLSANAAHDAYFFAALKTDHFGWVQATDDAAQLESVKVGRWRKLGPVATFDTWMEFPAWNRNPRQVDEHPLADDDYLVRQYRIDATVTSGAKLSATTTLALREREPGERVLLFNLDANLRVSSVKDGAGQSLSYFQPRAYGNGEQSHGDYVAVAMPQATAAGAAARLAFAYAGKHVIRKVGPGNYFCPSYGWYPSPTDNFATRADFSMTFHSPRRYILTATGEEVGRKKREGKQIVTSWKSSQPLTVAGFAFGSYKQFDSRVGPTTVQILANTNPDDFLAGVQEALNPDLPGTNPNSYATIGTLDPANTVKTMGQEIGNSLRVFDNYFGPYPYHKLTVTNIPYSYGQGWPTLIYLSALSFLDSTQRNVLGISDGYQLTDYFRAHETSHQWWGQLVGWKTYHDQWLSEGFAQFSGNLYVEFREGEKPFLQRLREDKEKLLEKNRWGEVYDSLGPVWMGDRLASSLAPEGYDVVVYDKGGWVLSMLRAMLWNPRTKDHDAAFKAMMHDFCRTYADKAASTEDFKAIVEKHMTRVMDLDGNHRMDWFFNQYVYGTGIPDYSFRYKIASAGKGKWRISGTIVRSGVSGKWEDILPLYAHIGKRHGRIGWIADRQPTTHFSFLMPQKPDKLSLNDNEEILANIHQ